MDHSSTARSRRSLSRCIGIDHRGVPRSGRWMTTLLSAEVRNAIKWRHAAESDQQTPCATRWIDIAASACRAIAFSSDRPRRP